MIPVRELNKIRHLNEKFYCGRGEYNYEDFNWCSKVDDLGYLLLDIKGKICYNVGVLSTQVDNRKLMLKVMKFIAFISEEFDEIRFVCRDDNTRLSKIFAKKYNCTEHIGANGLHYFIYRR